MNTQPDSTTGPAQTQAPSLVPDDGDVPGEYQAALTGAGLYDHRHRGLIQVTGRDRASWLNNLVTNVIKTLEPGQGNYAFALNVKGRILFDLNMLVLPDALWLDIDRRLVNKALAHLERHIISEDVQLLDRSAEFARFALLGPAAATIAEALGVTEVSSLPQIATRPATLVQKNRLLMRHDFPGVWGAELFVEAADADAVWNRLLEIGSPVSLCPVGHSAVEALRIEAGIPASVQDIDEDVLPAETQQLARAVSFKKGCYLGQEVVERMRSHHVLARKLMSLSLAGPVNVPSPLHAGELEAGRLTSASPSPATGHWIGLGYVKLAHSADATLLSAGTEPPVSVTVRSAPPRTPATL